MEDNESEEGKRRRVSRLVAHMEEREEEKETRKTHDDVEEKDLKEKEEAMMAQAHGILLTMDSILSLEGNSWRGNWYAQCSETKTEANEKSTRPQF